MKSSALTKYLYALELEYDSTEFTGKWTYNLNDSLLQIPIGFTYGKYIVKYDCIISSILPLLRLTWVLIGMPIYTIIWCARWIFTIGWSPQAICPSSIYLKASNNRYLFYVPESAGKPIAIITLPFNQSKQNTPIFSWHTDVIDIRNITTRKTIIKAALLSIKSAFCVYFSTDRKKTLFTYSAPNWFWVNEALESASPSSIWISNHYDRWTALVAGLPGSSVTIIQHGLLSQLDYRSEKRIFYKLKNKIINIKKIFVINTESIKDFKNVIGDDDIDFFVLNPRLHVVPWIKEHPKQLRIFVIGLPEIKKLFIQFTQTLSVVLKKENISIVYRPHPRESMPVTFPGLDTQLVSVQSQYDAIPEMDLILDYGSSFIDEVKAATSAKVFGWSPMDTDCVTKTVRLVTDYYYQVFLSVYSTNAEI